MKGTSVGSALTAGSGGGMSPVPGRFTDGGGNGEFEEVVREIEPRLEARSAFLVTSFIGQKQIAANDCDRRPWRRLDDL